MRRAWGALAVLLVALVPALAGAQVRDTSQARRDSLARLDSLARRDSLRPPSVLDSLMRRDSVAGRDTMPREIQRGMTINPDNSVVKGYDSPS